MNAKNLPPPVEASKNNSGNLRLATYFILKGEKMTPEYNLHQERVMHLELMKFTIVESGTSIRDTIRKMRAKNYNRTLITRNGELIGIFTDRDILLKVVSSPEIWDSPIDTVMSPSPFTVKTTDSAQTAITLMNRKHVRNVPVLDEKNRVVGNLTHYSLIKHLADHLSEAVYNLAPDPESAAHKLTDG